MMRGDDDIENNGHAFNATAAGARQRRAAGGNVTNTNYSYSSIPTQQPNNLAGYGPNSYDADLKKNSVSYTSTTTFDNLSQRSGGGGVLLGASGSGGLASLFTTTAHLTEGPNKPYYRDYFNDQPFSCDFGTGEENGIWMNTSDQAGTIMAFLVWVLLCYSAWTFTALAQFGGVPPFLSAAYVILCILALASHAKTTFTDPGSVPQSAVPNERTRREMGTPDAPLSMCSQCQTFKPPFTHHCRICNRCISRMDHHCPWVSSYCDGIIIYPHIMHDSLLNDLHIVSVIDE
jgi:hypothetical protein